jgi:hypothetical protein
MNKERGTTAIILIVEIVEVHITLRIVWVVHVNFRVCTFLMARNLGVVILWVADGFGWDCVEGGEG